MAGMPKREAVTWALVEGYSKISVEKEWSRLYRVSGKNPSKAALKHALGIEQPSPTISELREQLSGDISKENKIKTPKYATVDSKNVHRDTSDDDVEPINMKSTHRSILNHFDFEHWGNLHLALESHLYDGHRVIYAISAPGGIEIVYVGEAEKSRDVVGRLKEHVDTHSKMKDGVMSLDSHVWILVMITEKSVLNAFLEDTKFLPKLNKIVTQKHAPKN